MTVDGVADPGQPFPRRRWRLIAILVALAAAHPVTATLWHRTSRERVVLVFETMVTGDDATTGNGGAAGTGMFGTNGVSGQNGR